MENRTDFLQKHSPDGGFLQSERWRAFQEAVGHESVHVGGEGFLATAFVHELPVVGEYLYVPRGPVVGRITPARNASRSEAGGNHESRITRQKEIEEGMEELIEKARKADAKWIRIEPATEEILEEMRKACSGYGVVLAPHEVQPHEIFKVSLAPSEEDLLAAMKSKTRYNIRLAEKKGVTVFSSEEKRHRETFIRLVRETAQRKRLTPHPPVYYEKMLETLLGNGGKLFIAEHDGDVLAANLVILFGATATYLHGGLSSKKRELMAPYLLQWTAMREAKRKGCAWYDFGGVNKEEYEAGRTEGKWYGITKFKFGFSPKTEVVTYPGTYDLILDKRVYQLYNSLRLVRENYVYLRKFMGI